MATEGRVRRSVRFAQLDAQPSASSAQVVSLRRERFHTGERLQMPSFQHSQDWVSGVGTSPSGRFRIVEEPQKKQKPFSRSGVRADWARVLIWVLAVVCSVSLLVRVASIGASSLRIQKLETRISAAEIKSRELQVDLVAMGSDASLCAKAVELNLISSAGAPTIYLTAPERATMNLMTEQEAQATEEPELRAASGGVQ